MSESPSGRKWPAELSTGPRLQWPSPDAALDWPLHAGADSVSRRRFMALAGASAALAAGAACSRPDRGGIVPAARKVPEAAPGVTSRYASTFAEGQASTSVLVRTREGRPIHVEGNDLDPFAAGVAPLRAIADVLRLYDPDRLRQPLLDGRPATWDEALSRLGRGLSAAREAQRPVLLLTGAATSPTRRALIDDLRRALPSLEHVVHEPASSDTERAGLLAAFGAAVRPRPRIERARVLLALDADPLGSGDPAAVVTFASQRRPTGPDVSMSRLWVLEGGLTLTGAKADERRPLAPRHVARVAFALARRLHERGLALPAGLSADTLAPFTLDVVARQAGLAPEWLARLAEDLRGAAQGAGLVLAGAALPVEAHVAAHLLNAQLGADGSTLDVARAPEPETVIDHAGLRALLERMAAGEVGAAILWGVNPAYTFPDAALVQAALEKTPTTAVIGLQRDETAALTKIVLAESHWLEAWGDHAPARDVLTLQQPALERLYDTRQGEDVLLGLTRGLGQAALPTAYADYLKARWQGEVHGGRLPVPFERFWHAALHDGVVRQANVPPPQPRVLRPQAVVAAQSAALVGARAVSEGFDLTLTTGALHDGRYANNGWLQELPDPITKLTWGNVVTLAPGDAARLQIVDGDVVRVTSGATTLALPALVQPGQAAGVLTVRLGYGRRTGSVATSVGVNAFVLQQEHGGPALVRDVRLEKTGTHVVLPTTQMHHRMEGRDIVRSTTVAALATSAHAPGEHGGQAHDAGGGHATLYPETPRGAHKWAMAIDLSSCVGCSACVVACQSENNVPVVGPEQVRRGREMHWIRIDRYYEGDLENPQVLQQPMLCQHCDHAPCETVCPVNATTHSPDGLNQMAYNRCVGTRYCANNCPYKVRRFNFLDFTGTKKEPETLAMNPEVTVRPRGVMEKCTFCVQRIEETRAQSKAEGRTIRDGEIRPACGVACPAQAIVFGDIQDPGSRIARIARDPRGYHVLAEVGTRPAVTYLAEVKNPAGGSSDADCFARTPGQRARNDNATTRHREPGSVPAAPTRHREPGSVPAGEAIQASAATSPGTGGRA